MFIANRQKQIQLLITAYTFFFSLSRKHSGVLFFKKKNYFPVWHGSIFSFEILMVNCYDLFKKCPGSLETWERMTKPCGCDGSARLHVSAVLCPSLLRSPGFLNSSSLTVGTLNHNVYWTQVPTQSNKINHPSLLLPLQERVCNPASSVSVPSQAPWSGVNTMSFGEEKILKVNSVILYMLLILIESQSLLVSSRNDVIPGQVVEMVKWNGY